MAKPKVTKVNKKIADLSVNEIICGDCLEVMIKILKKTTLTNLTKGAKNEYAKKVQQNRNNNN